MLALDKQYTSPLEEELGSIGIRVVVFAKGKAKSNSGSGDLDVPDLEEGEDFSVGDSEVNSYLELPKRGKQCCVFVINGQRHHGLDNSFIVNDLRMKYLRKRMIIAVDLDALTQRAIAEIMQGSRSGLYEGKAYHRIYERLISTLKGDPDLLELEEEAEEELSKLQVGDEAVQQALDQLIQDHFAAGDHSAEGGGDSIGAKGVTVTEDGKKVHMDVVRMGTEGELADYPALMCNHAGPSLRIRPNEDRKLYVSVEPNAEWANVTGMVTVVEPAISGLDCVLDRKDTHAAVNLKFTPPEGFDSQQYPLEARLSVLATFKEHKEVRLVDKLIVIRPPTYSPPPPPPVLRDEPTFLKVASRQPVRIVPDGAAVHVRMRWDGKDELASTTPPVWVFEGTCTSHKGAASLTFTKPMSGRFEALIHTAGELLIGTKLKFEVRAIGPGAPLSTSLDAEVVAAPAAPEPRKGKADVAAHGERRPPYKVSIVTEDEFSSNTRWGEETWDHSHAGAFVDPKEDAPLTLCINQDFGLLKSYLESLKVKKADEKRTEEKKTKYISHIAYHLYQMYLHKEGLIKAKEANADVQEPRDEDMQAEVNRVASTLVRLMEVTR